MDKWKCFYCGKEVEGKEKCDCEKSKSGWSYISANAVKTDNDWECTCGYDGFTTKSHMDFSDSFSTTYKCGKCGNHIGVHCERTDSWW